jgi:hypothetical protein
MVVVVACVPPEWQPEFIQVPSLGAPVTLKPLFVSKPFLYDELTATKANKAPKKITFFFIKNKLWVK